MYQHQISVFKCSHDTFYFIIENPHATGFYHSSFAFFNVTTALMLVLLRNLFLIIYHKYTNAYQYQGNHTFDACCLLFSPRSHAERITPNTGFINPNTATREIGLYFNKMPHSVYATAEMHAM